MKHLIHLFFVISSCLSSLSATGNLRMINGFPDPVSLLPDDPLEKIESAGKEKNLLKKEVVAFSEGKALRLAIDGLPANKWNVSLTIPIRNKISKGDAVFVYFKMRCIQSMDESGQAVSMVILKKEGEAGNIPVAFKADINAGREWKELYFPFASDRDFDAGGGHFQMALGFRPQTFEIADLRILNFEKKVPKEKLPTMQITYQGRDPDAVWRVEALNRIEKIRKGDFELAVLRESGEPLVASELNLTLVKHHFAFGGLIKEFVLNDPVRGNPSSADVARFRDTYLKLFQKATLPNGLKWKNYPVWGKDLVPPAATWLKSKNIPIHGHCLVWPRWIFMPDWVREKHGSDPAALRQVTIGYVKEQAERWKDQVVEWDVLNEPVGDTQSLMDLCGREIMGEWFAAARGAAPRAKLFVNENQCLEGSDDRHRKEFVELLTYLVKQKIDFDGIGLQGHFRELIPPEEVLRRLDLFGSFGKEVHITEFDVNIADESAQGDYTRDFLILSFSHPSVNGIISWHGGSIWEGLDPTEPNCAFYRKDWSQKPNGKAWEDLVCREWRTDIKSRTDSLGKTKGRGFFGEYEVSADIDGKPYKGTFSFSKDGEKAQVVLKSIKN